MMKAGFLALFSVLCMATAHAEQQPINDVSHQDAIWHPLHFKPAIETATDEQCLECHKEVLEVTVRESSPAGVTAAGSLAWYQTLGTYAGDQETLHRRHMVTDYAKQVMDMKCNTCHQGNDPRDENPGSSATADGALTLRKHVDPNVCLMCHGKFPYQYMGVPGPWTEFKVAFQDNCLLCHAGFRTNRHNVNYLKADAIEEMAKTDNDVCYGCHGGRAWYRITFPYPRHPWPGSAGEVPEWAKGRPTQSEPRFLVGVSVPAGQVRPKADKMGE